jgi:hypothetical protein
MLPHPRHSVGIASPHTCLTSAGKPCPPTNPPDSDFTASLRWMETTRLIVLALLILFVGFAGLTIRLGG